MTALDSAFDEHWKIRLGDAEFHLYMNYMVKRWKVRLLRARVELHEATWWGITDKLVVAKTFRTNEEAKAFWDSHVESLRKGEKP